MGRFARLLGGSLRVGVAETAPMPAKAERRTAVFIVDELDGINSKIQAVVLSKKDGRWEKDAIRSEGVNEGTRVREGELQSVKRKIQQRGSWNGNEEGTGGMDGGMKSNGGRKKEGRRGKRE